MISDRSTLCLKRLPVLLVSLLIALVFAGHAEAQRSYLSNPSYLSPSMPAQMSPGTGYYEGGYEPGFSAPNRYVVTPSYSPGAYGNVYPQCSAPYTMPGGYFGIKIGNAAYNFWHSDSGYYYPWCKRPVGYTLLYGYGLPVLQYQQGYSTPTQPPLSTEMNDLAQFIGDEKAKGHLDDGDFRSLSLRLDDLRHMEESASSQDGGSLDPQTDADLRKQLQLLGDDVSRRIKS